MSATIVGLFENQDRAEAVRNDLIEADFDRSEIRLSAEPAEGREQEESNAWEWFKDWLGVEESAYYEEAARRGNTLVTVTTADDRAELAAGIIERHNPMDVDVQAKQWEQEGWQGPKPEARREEQRQEQQGFVPQGGQPQRTEQQRGEEEHLPLAEEELRVGKRRVTRGGARIYTHVTERPAEEQVELTDEHVDVQRRDVDRPAGEDAFQERTVEASETHEEPVVDKEARVKEELVLRKDAEEHTETVRDTVRETEAEVEGGGEQAGDRTAYDFARELAEDSRFRGRSFEEIEPEARQAFERRNLGDWTSQREAIRQAYQRGRAA